MESLIKQKMYSNAIELYNETKDDKDKRLFINYTVSDKELRNYLVQYIVSQNNLLILNMFLTKIFTLIKKNYNTLTQTDYAFHEILTTLLKSDSIYKDNNNLLQIYICHLLKMRKVNSQFQKELIDYITFNKINEEGWLELLLENLELYDELGLLFEKLQQYDKSYQKYLKAKNKEKIREIEETLNMVKNEM